MIKITQYAKDGIVKFTKHVYPGLKRKNRHCHRVSVWSDPLPLHVIHQSEQTAGIDY